MRTQIYSEQLAKGLENASKSLNNLKAGDFVLMYGHGAKNDNGTKGIMRDIVGGWPPYRRLARIEGIIHTATDADLLDERFDNPYGGGNASDCIEEGEGPYSPEAIQTYYTLCTLVISDESGRALAFDREGYEYNRYILFTLNYRQMWSSKLQEVREQVEAEKEAERIEREKQEAEIKAEFDAFCEGLSDSDSLRVTLRKLIERNGIKAKIKARKCHYLGDIVTIFTRPEDMQAVKDIIWKAESFQIPSEDSVGYYPLFQNKFGNWEYIGYENL